MLGADHAFVDRQEALHDLHGVDVGPVLQDRATNPS